MGLPDEMLTCPFNRNHQILRTRMPWHIVKCRKNYKEEALSICPFNAMHMMPERELKEHFKECQDLQINYQPFEEEPKGAESS